MLKKIVHNLTAIDLTHYRFMFGSIIGMPLAFMFDHKSLLFIINQGINPKYILIAYFWTFYTYLIVLLYLKHKSTQQNIKEYQEREVVLFRKRSLYDLWLWSFLATVAILFVLLMQNHFRLPILNALRAFDNTEYSILRSNIKETININLYNLGVKVFGTFSLIVALFYLKNRVIVTVTALTVVLLASFSLAKGSIGTIVILIFFYYVLMQKPKFRDVQRILFVLMILILLMFIVSKQASFATLFRSLFQRLFYGQWAALPSYYSIFEHSKAPFISLLPPYIQSMLGSYTTSPARIVMSFLYPYAIKSGAAGVATTVFIGEAYSVFGTLGVIVSPFIVLFYFNVVIRLFVKIQKNIIMLFLFAYFMDRLTTGLLTGISVFLFSSVQLLLFVVIYLIMMRRSVSKV